MASMQVVKEAEGQEEGLRPGLLHCNPPLGREMGIFLVSAHEVVNQRQEKLFSVRPFCDRP